MNQRIKLAAGLALVLFALGGLATWDEWQTKREKEIEASKNRLTQIKSDDVVELTYYSDPEAADAADAEPKTEPAKLVDVSIKRDNGLWNLQRPINARADSGTVESLIKTITDFSYGKVVTEDKARWTEFGLAEPKRWIKLKTGDQHPTELTVFVGAKVPVGYEVYFRTSDGNRVYTGSQHLLLSTSKSLLEFRDKLIATVEEPKVTALTYQRRGEDLIEITRTEGNYGIIRPQQLDGDSPAIKELIDEFGNMRAIGFVDSPDEALRSAFVDPEVVVTFSKQGSEQVVFKFVEYDEKLMIMTTSAPTVYILGDEWKSKIKKQLMDFRSRRIFEADTASAKTIEIDGQLYKNIAGNWYTVSDAEKISGIGKPAIAASEKPTELSHIRALIVDLEFAKTDKFIDLNGPEAKSLPAAPLHRIVLGYEDSKRPPISIDAFKVDGDSANYLVRRTGGAFIYRVPVTVFGSMTAAVGNSENPVSTSTPMDAPMDDDDGADLGGGVVDPNVPANSGTPLRDQAKPG